MYQRAAAAAFDQWGAVGAGRKSKLWNSQSSGYCEPEPLPET